MRNRTHREKKRSYRPSLAFILSCPFLLDCAAGEANGDPWPAVPRLESTNSSGASSTSSTGGEKDSSTESDPEPSPEVETNGSSTTGDVGPDSETSSTSDDSGDQTESTSDEDPGTEKPDDDSGTDDEELPDPNACVQKVCAQINPQGAGSAPPEKLGQYIFYFGAEKWARRLARIELVEGMTTGETKIALKSDGGGKHGDLIGSLSWTERSQDELDWAGADLPTPVNIENDEWIWVEVTPAEGLFASKTTQGTPVPIWTRDEPFQSWRPFNAPVMFRAFCCVEDEVETRGQ